jgi:hypothetical protein
MLLTESTIPQSETETLPAAPDAATVIVGAAAWFTVTPNEAELAEACGVLESVTVMQ